MTVSVSKCLQANNLTLDPAFTARAIRYYTSRAVEIPKVTHVNFSV